MKQLTKREDQIMEIVWRLQTGSTRDILEEFPDPRPHYNTLATLVKILVEKGFLEATKVGNTYKYRPTSFSESYRDERVSNIKKRFFGNSLPKMLAHFAKKEELSEAEKAELIRIIKSGKS